MPEDMRSLLRLGAYQAEIDGANRPNGGSISQSPFPQGDLTKPKRWADELKETATHISNHRDPEGFSAYIYMLERCKQTAKRGEFSTVFWKKNLHLWTKEELIIAAELLRRDSFSVEVTDVSDDVRVHINWQ